MPRRWPLAIVALAVGGCAASRVDSSQSDLADMAEALSGRVAGAAQRCIGPSPNSGPRIVGESLLYPDGRRVWVSQAVDGCPALRRDPIIVVEVHGSEVCANDLFRTIDRGGSIPGPYCRFGPFVPFTKPR